MSTAAALASAECGLGNLFQRDPMSKAEEMEELRLREDIVHARRQAGAENEREPPCRAVRVLVGAKD